MTFVTEVSCFFSATPGDVAVAASSAEFMSSVESAQNVTSDNATVIGNESTNTTSGKSVNRGEVVSDSALRQGPASHFSRPREVNGVRSCPHGQKACADGSKCYS